MTPNRICILGHGESGKDKLAEIISLKTGLSFTSSSRTACNYIMPMLKERYGLIYMDEVAAYEDRRNKRTEWYECIKALNAKDKAFLAKKIYDMSHIYVGPRDYDEFKACRDIGLHQLVIWVDRDVPADTTMKIPRSEADVIIDNNGTVRDLTNKVEAMLRYMPHV